MNLQYLRYFQVLNKWEHFTKAAEELGTGAALIFASEDIKIIILTGMNRKSVDVYYISK